MSKYKFSQFEADLGVYRNAGHSAHDGYYCEHTHYEYVEKGPEKLPKVQSIELEEALKNSPNLIKWIGRIDGKIRVYEKVTYTSKTGRQLTKWVDKTKDLPDWAIEPVMRIMRNWQKA